MRSKKINVRTLQEYSEDIAIAILGLREGEENDRSLPFNIVQTLLPNAIRHTERIPMISGASKRAIVIQTFRLIMDQYVIDADKPQMDHWVKFSLPQLIDEIVILSKSKALIKRTILGFC